MPLIRPLRVIIPGGTGPLGQLLASYLHNRGHLVSTLTRFPRPYPWEAIHWDVETLGHWVSSFESADAIINFTGSQAQSRATQLIRQAFQSIRNAPKTWINLSEPGQLSSETRIINLDLAPVMTPNSGPFPLYLRLARSGFGGHLGSGEQYLDWIHQEDFLHGLGFLITSDHLQGRVSLTAPNSITNHQFMADLRHACHTTFGLPLPVGLVKLLCFVTNHDSNLFLKSGQRIPIALQAAGFQFQFPNWSQAAEDLVRRQ